MVTTGAADAASEPTGLLQLLSLVWMELAMAALAALVYVALSGKFLPASAPGKAKLTGQKRAAGLPRSGPSACSLARGSNGLRTRALDCTRDGSARLAGAEGTVDGRRAGTLADDSCSDSDRSVALACVRGSQGSPASGGVASDVSAQARAIRACGKSGHVADAVDIYERAKCNGHGANSLLFNTLLDVFIECGALEKAEEYFERAKSRRFITVVTYNTMMKGYLAQKKVAEAEALLQELAARGLTATQASYHGLIQTRLRMGDRAGAWKMVGEMQEHHIAPNAVTCAIMLKGVLPASTAEKIRVLEMVQALETPIDEVLFVLVVEACLAMDRLDYLTSMRAAYAKQRGPCSISAAVYGTMVKAYGKAHDVSSVRGLWAEMMTRRVKLTSITVGCVVEALVANRDVQYARELLQDMWTNQEQRPLLNTVIYSTIIKGYVSARQPEEVMGLYDEMRDRGIQPNSITYNTILNAFAQCKKMDRAPQLLQEMHEAEPRVEPDIITYSTIVKGYCASGELDKALDLLKSIKADAKLTPDEVTYNSLLDGCAKQHRLEAALELVSDMKTAGVSFSNFTLSILVKLLGRCRRLDQAFEAVDTLSKEHGFQVNVQVYTCLIQACFNNRQPGRALALHERMLGEGLGLDEKAYTAILRGCLQFGSLDSAVHIVRCAYGIAKGSVAAPGVERRCLEELLRVLGPDTEAGSRLACEIRSSTRCRARADGGPARRPEARDQASIRRDGRVHGRP